MSRQFNGVNEQVLFNPGTATFGQGPITVACLIKPTTVAGTRQPISATAVTNAETYGLLFDTSQYFCVNLFSPGPNAVNNDWQWIVYTKAAGNVAPRFHFRDVTVAGAWSHANAGGTADNGTSPAVNLSVGALPTGGRWYGGLVAAMATWGSVLSDVQVEGACTLAASDLAAASPAWATLWNQASVATPVPDFTGHGGNQSSISGTSVSADDPPGFNYALTSTVTGTGVTDLGALSAAASGGVIVGGTAVGDLGALGGTASGLVTVTGAALSDLGRLTATATTPDPDQFVSVLMEKLLQCMCEQVALQPNPPQHCCFRVGTEIAHDAGILQDLCCEGIAYVALGDTYASSDSFPEQDIVRQAAAHCAPTTWAQAFKVGIIRCTPTGDQFLPPSCDEWNAAARQNVVDAQTLRRVACCMRNFVVNNGDVFFGMSFVIDRQTQGNPQGGCVERSMTLTAQFPNCDC